CRRRRWARRRWRLERGRQCTGWGASGQQSVSVVHRRDRLAAFHSLYQVTLAAGGRGEGRGSERAGRGGGQGGGQGAEGEGGAGREGGKAGGARAEGGEGGDGGGTLQNEEHPRRGTQAGRAGGRRNAEMLELSGVERGRGGAPVVRTARKEGVEAPKQMVRKDEQNTNEGNSRSWTGRRRSGDYETRGGRDSKDSLPDARDAFLIEHLCSGLDGPSCPIKASKWPSWIFTDGPIRLGFTPAHTLAVPQTAAMSGQPAPTKRALRSNSTTKTVVNLGLNPEPKPARVTKARKGKTAAEAADTTAVQEGKKSRKKVVGKAVQLPSNPTPLNEQDVERNKDKKLTPKPAPPPSNPSPDDEDEEDLLPNVNSRGHTPYDKGMAFSAAPRAVGTFQRQPHTLVPVLPPTTNDNNNNNNNNTESNFSDSEKERQKAEHQHNEIARQVPWEGVYVSEEEEEAEAMKEYQQDARGEGRRRRKRRVTDDEHGEHDSDADQDDADEPEPDDDAQEPDDDDPTCPPPWEIKPGPLSAAGVNKALAARQAYHNILREVARDDGKKVSAVLKAIGETTKLGRKTNPWNAFHMQEWSRNPQPKGMSKKEYHEVVRAKYRELFAHLSEDDAKDPGARAACVADLMFWYSEATTVMLDDQKANDRGHAMLTKSTVTANTRDIEICGYAIDPFTDNAIIWGGGQFFSGVYARFKDAIKRELSDIKAMHQYRVVAMESRDAAARGIDHPIIIDFAQTSTEKNHRDTRRRLLHKMFLNDILAWSNLRLLSDIALAQRGDNLVPPKDMSWKWLDMAIKLRLRIVEWPVELKLVYPRPGFAIANIKDAAAMKVMVVAMKARYLGTEDAVEEDTPRIVSWTEEECDLPLTDMLDVPLVVCADGSILLQAHALKDLLKRVARKGKRKASDREESEDDGDNGNDNEDDDSDAPEVSNKRKAPEQTGRTPAASGSTSNAASGSNGAGSQSAPSGASGLTCRYINGEDVSESFVGTVVKYHGEPTRIQRQTQVWTAGSWRALPKGLGVAVSEDAEPHSENFAKSPIPIRNTTANIPIRKLLRIGSGEERGASAGAAENK
ncbi:hypothetical protein B0H17DRAFT_1152191, partial [Mycena rosella]